MNLTLKEVYMQNCVACHGASGKGTIPGAPDFTDSNGVLMKSDKALLEHMATNHQNPGIARTMPPKGGNPNLTNQELKESLTYIRKTFGKKSASIINPVMGGDKSSSKTNEASLKNKLNEVQSVKPSTQESLQHFSANAARGASAWATTCSTCHNARSPSSLSPEQWHTVMLHMRRQANLTGQQTRDILMFLKNSCQ